MTDQATSNPRKGGISWLEQNGQKIIYHDFHDCNAEEILAVMVEGRKITRSQPENSLLELVDVRGGSFNLAVAEGMKEYAAGNKPYSKKCAIVGIDGLKKVILQAVTVFSGREFGLFDTVEEAKEWLIGNE